MPLLLSNNNKRRRTFDDKCRRYSRAPGILKNVKKREKKAKRCTDDNKRRDTNDKDEPVPAPNTPPPSIDTALSKTVTYVEKNLNKGAARVIPQLEETPKILFQDMQKSIGDNVADALRTLSLKLHGKCNLNWEHCLRECCSLGATSAIVVVMNRWHDNPDVQYYGCLCLTNLIGCDTEETKRSTISMVKSGGVETIINAMRAGSDSDEVHLQICGLGALSKILSALQDNSIAVNSIKHTGDRFVNDLGGISLALQAMKKFPGNSRIQRLGCLMFCDLARKAEYCGAMKKTSVVRVVCIAIEKYPNDEDIQYAASGFMKSMFG